MTDITIIAIAPVDPNEKAGLIGQGPQQLILPENELQYTIYFENVITATAPAQQVIVLDHLSPNLDWTSFAPTEITFGDRVIALSAQKGGYYGTVSIPDYRPDVGQSWIVEIEVETNYLTGKATWTLTTLNPLTGELPDDPLAGFLPPEDGTGRGQGHVSFAVRPRADIILGTVITNQASITFDYNAPILTNIVWNTVDHLKVYLPLVMRE